VQFQKVFYRYVSSASGPATVAMGADSAPTTVYGTAGVPPAAQTPTLKSAANVDNILSCRNWGSSAPAPVRQVAVALSGPTGATSPTANLYVWDGLTQHWYLVNASPVTIAPEAVTLIPVISPAENLALGGPPSNQQSNNGADYMLVLIANGSPTAGVYSIAMTAVLAP
jgi:hypothetical protein